MDALQDTNKSLENQISYLEFYVYLEKLNIAEDLPNYLVFANNLSSSKTNNLNTKVYEALKDASEIGDKRSLFY